MTGRRVLIYSLNVITESFQNNKTVNNPVSVAQLPKIHGFIPPIYFRWPTSSESVQQTREWEKLWNSNADHAHTHTHTHTHTQNKYTIFLQQIHALFQQIPVLTHKAHEMHTQKQQHKHIRSTHETHTGQTRNTHEAHKKYTRSTQETNMEHTHTHTHTETHTHTRIPAHGINGIKKRDAFLKWPRPGRTRT